ncbi:MAG: dTMP kinase [Firmicutes bacterium]|nr:dTMP kinase [Bacillota bacterium]
MSGFFISVEGGDGSGKSTQLENIKGFLKENNIEFIFTREPGGTEISEKIRSIILDPNNTEMADITEALLYAASRAQHVAEKIKPALDSGKTVVCDRFVDSSIVYQGYGRGLGDVVKAINAPAVNGYMPHITFFLDISPEDAMPRIKSRNLDRLEMGGMELHKKIYEGYKKLIAEDNTGRIVSIDANRSPEEIWQDIKMVLEEKCL